MAKIKRKGSRGGGLCFNCKVSYEVLSEKAPMLVSRPQEWKLYITTILHTFVLVHTKYDCLERSITRIVLTICS